MWVVTFWYDGWKFFWLHFKVIIELIFRDMVLFLEKKIVQWMSGTFYKLLPSMIFLFFYMRAWRCLVSLNG